MNEKELIEKTAAFVQKMLKDAEGGHDWWHIYRVWKNARYIAKSEQGAKQLVVELGTLDARGDALDHTHYRSRGALPKNFLPIFTARLPTPPPQGEMKWKFLQCDGAILRVRKMIKYEYNHGEISTTKTAIFIWRRTP